MDVYSINPILEIDNYYESLNVGINKEILIHNDIDSYTKNILNDALNFYRLDFVDEVFIRTKRDFININDVDRFTTISDVIMFDEGTRYSQRVIPPHEKNNVVSKMEYMERKFSEIKLSMSFLEYEYKNDFPVLFFGHKVLACLEYNPYIDIQKEDLIDLSCKLMDLERQFPGMRNISIIRMEDYILDDNIFDYAIDRYFRPESGKVVFENDRTKNSFIIKFSYNFKIDYFNNSLKYRNKQ